MRPNHASVIALITLLPTAHLVAQAALSEPTGVTAGARVLVDTFGARRPFVGKVLAVRSDTLWIRSSDSVVVSPERIRSLFISRGRGSRAESALGFATLTAVAGAVVGYFVTNNASCSGCDSPGAIGAISFGAFGLILGGIVGAAVGQDRWDQVQWPPAKIPAR
jgi:hypothetical protein